MSKRSFTFREVINLPQQQYVRDTMYVRNQIARAESPSRRGKTLGVTFPSSSIGHDVSAAESSIFHSWPVHQLVEVLRLCGHVGPGWASGMIP